MGVGELDGSAAGGGVVAVVDWARVRAVDSVKRRVIAQDGFGVEERLALLELDRARFMSMVSLTSAKITNRQPPFYKTDGERWGMSAGMGGEEFFVGAVEGVHEGVNQSELALEGFDLLFNVVGLAFGGVGIFFVDIHEGSEADDGVACGLAFCVV